VRSGIRVARGCVAAGRLRGEKIQEAIAKVKKKFKRIDILVNNAGNYIRQEIETMATEDIDQVISVNLRGDSLH
jgi:NADP-dependent 3-hydroxy acid dehydrogenase YdfG